ncbi:hypothetical protein VTL71DRAFT_787 [Oculimacula yallundae]|uniref:Mid2 domain-containing protein n=1 Tax=Oculimacula yallundae TaxID=86028 RepID=A0ABR4D3C6_9HELO
MMFVFAGWRVTIILGFLAGSLGVSRGTDVGLPNDNDRIGVGVQQVVQEQRIVLPTVTVKSTIIISHPKITDGPSLVRRKLGSIKWDAIHNGIQGQKRDMNSCPPSYNLCPKAMKGGCCPEDRVCGTSSCFPKSVASASACGKSGYQACGIPEGGGCCPSDYQCATNGCIPRAGVNDVRTCSADAYLCPASLNYGCCKSGLGCALDGCFATSISTFTYTKTLTTTDESSKPHTLTTTIIATTVLNAPDATETVETDGLRGKTFPSQTAIAKVEATGITDSGLTKPQMGGIIGGAIAILGVILIVAFIIIKRLNRAIRVSEQANSNTHSSSSGNRSSPRKQNIDEMSVDPLMMTASQASGSIRRPYNSHNPSFSTNIEVELEDNSPASPPSFNTQSFSPRSPPHTHYSGGYNPVSSSDSQYSTSSGGHRHHSLESSPPMHHNPNAGYFDIYAQTQAQSQLQPQPQSQPQSQPNPNHRHSQVSQISPLRPNHIRNWSDASSISQTSSAALDIPELDSADGERKIAITSKFSRALHSFGMGSITVRRKSESIPPSPRSVGPLSLSGGPQSPDWVPSPREGLLNIPEAGESRVGLDHGSLNAQFRDVPLVGSEGTFGGGSVRGGTSDGSTLGNSMLGNGTFGEGMIGTRMFGGRAQSYDLGERSRR